MNNCRRFPLYELDSGKDNPLWFVPPRLSEQRLAMIMPSSRKDGGCDMHLTFPKGEMETFLFRRAPLRA